MGGGGLQNGADGGEGAGFRVFVGNLAWTTQSPVTIQIAQCCSWYCCCLLPFVLVFVQPRLDQPVAGRANVRNSRTQTRHHRQGRPVQGPEQTARALARSCELRRRVRSVHGLAIAAPDELFPFDSRSAAAQALREHFTQCGEILRAEVFTERSGAPRPAPPCSRDANPSPGGAAAYRALGRAVGT